MSEAKPFDIPKALVWEAWQRVKANKGAAGVDGQTIGEFEADLSKNLYRIWNRMSSGTYFPPAIRAVPIPKKSGGERMLGVPTVGDRVAQASVTLLLVPNLERVFHDDSYGYRPGRSAHDALAVTRKRCWERNWVLEYDIRGLFDNIDHELLLRALRKHCDEDWVHLLVRRWLTAPMRGQDGIEHPRTVGTPQGGPLSPVLANLFLHYALDRWLTTHHPDIPFCRYADDGILHCRTEDEANRMRKHLAARLSEVGLELHPEKTRVVYCKDSNRRDDHENVQFDFLGYTFRPREAPSPTGGSFTAFMPAMSRTAAKAIRGQVHRWKASLRSHASLEDMAEWFSPTIRGWIGYYTRFNRNEFRLQIAVHLDRMLIRWAKRKFKRLRGRTQRAWAWLKALKRRQPTLFPHWSMTATAETMGAR